MDINNPVVQMAGAMVGNMLKPRDGKELTIRRKWAFWIIGVLIILIVAWYGLRMLLDGKNEHSPNNTLLKSENVKISIPQMDGNGNGNVSLSSTKSKVSLRQNMSYSSLSTSSCGSGSSSDISSRSCSSSDN